MLPSRRTTIVCVVLYGIVGLIVYGSSLRNAFVNIDDDYLITQNPSITRMTSATLAHVFTSYDPELYIPLTFVSYQIDYQLGALSPGSYHLQSLAWHIANALLVAAILWMLTGSAAISISLGLLFLAHPLNVEAVAWASARKDVLSTFFLLSSFISYMRDRSKTSIALFMLGLLAKVTVVVLPVLLVLYDLQQGRMSARESVKSKWLYWTLAVVFGIIALFGKRQAFVATTLVQQMLMACASVWLTVQHMVIPTSLSVFYPLSGAIAVTNPTIGLSILGVITLLVLGGIAAYRSRTLALGLGWMAVTILPTLNNFSRSYEINITSDRYAYLPMIGGLMLLSVLLTKLFRTSRTWTIGYGSVATVILLTTGLATSSQATVWNGNEALYRHVLTLYPHAFAAHNNLGTEYLIRRQYAEALAEFDAALEEQQIAVTVVNRGRVFAAQGKSDDAAREFAKALALDPVLFESYYEMGNLSYTKGDLDAAASWYAKALERNPGDMNSLNNIGGILLRKGEWPKAEEYLRKLLAINPLFTEGYYNLGIVFEQTGRRGEAAAMYRKALQLNPNDADAAERLQHVTAP